MNINLSPIFDVSNNDSNVNSANEYVNMLASNGYFPLITCSELDLTSALEVRTRDDLFGFFNLL